MPVTPSANIGVVGLAVMGSNLARNLASREGNTVAVFNRKANLGRLQHPIGFRFRFEEDRTVVSRTDLAHVDEFAAKLPLTQRMAHLLQGGAMTIAAIAAELEAAIQAALRRKDRPGVRVIAATHGVSVNTVQRIAHAQ